MPRLMSASRQMPGALRIALLANGTFSGVSGCTIMYFAHPLNDLLGTSSRLPDTALIILGALLAGFATTLYVVAMQQTAYVGWVKLIVGLDVAWVVGSVLLVVLGTGILSSIGRTIVIGVAVAVAGFALAQYVGLKPATGSTRTGL